MEKPAVKLAIRTKREDGVIVAYVSDMDEKHMLPIASLSLEIAEKDRALFEAWMKGMEGVMTAFCQSTFGLTPSSFFRFNLGDKQ